MKKKVFVMMSALCMSVAGFSQISASDFTVGVAGNYTMYKGDFQRSTPGVKVELGYGLLKKVGFSLSYTKGFPIKTASQLVVSNSTGNSQTIPAEVRTNFSTIALAAQYRLVGSEESAFGLYLPFGAAYVAATSKQKTTQSVPAGYTTSEGNFESDKESGLTLNLGLGAQYSIGMPTIFAEGALALPANKAGDTYITNYIPGHFILNAGVRITLGARED